MKSAQLKTITCRLYPGDKPLIRDDCVTLSFIQSTQSDALYTQWSCDTQANIHSPFSGREFLNCNANSFYVFPHVRRQSARVCICYFFFISKRYGFSVWFQYHIGFSFIKFFFNFYLVSVLNIIASLKFPEQKKKTKKQNETDFFLACVNQVEHLLILLWYSRVKMSNRYDNFECVYACVVAFYLSLCLVKCFAWFGCR